MEQEHDKLKAAESLAGVQGKDGVAALKGDKTLANLAQQYAHSDQITDWNTQLLECSVAGFGEKQGRENVPDLWVMQAKVD